MNIYKTFKIKLTWREYFKIKIRALAYPMYDCQQCYGPNIKDLQCVCRYYHCVAPKRDPSLLRKGLRKVLERMG